MLEKQLQNKKVAVIGFGLEGQAVTKFLLKHGVKPVLFDQNQLSTTNKQYLKNKSIKFTQGKEAFKKITGFDLVFRSPGVPLSKLKSLTSEITSQTKYFFEHCPAQIIGVTGTKGKGTTSTLIYKILKESEKRLHRKVYLTGNIGKIQALDFISRLKPNDLVVYELSSFQLQDLRISPHVAVVLMTTSEHLDYHKNLFEYLKAKSNITKYQASKDFAVVNLDYENSVKIGKQGKGSKNFFSIKKVLSNGSYYSGEAVYLKNSKHLNPVKIIDVKNLLLRGEHNYENVCAAIQATTLLGSSIFEMQRVLKNFKGLEHRLERLGQKKGISFYNDSFSTTPETTIAAIKSFNEPEILILGGSSKKSNFKILGKIISNTHNIKALILIGQEAKRILQEIPKSWLVSHKIYIGAKNMKEVFSQISKIAIAGDVVLFSPACASFDMFQNYIDRGLQFKKNYKTFK